MRARPNPSGEQLVTDYLTQVAQQARLLPKGARMAFVGRTRALVERELGRPGTRTDPEHVSAVLDRLGTPEDLVTAERTRIDRRWVKSRASSKEEGEAAAAALTGPLNRSLTTRRRLGTDTQPLGQPADASPGGPQTGAVVPSEGTGSPGAGSPGAESPGAGSPGVGPRRSGLRGAGPRGAGPQSTGPRSTGLRGVGPRSAGLRSASPRGSGPRADGLRSADSPGAGPEAAPPPGADPLGTGPRGTGPHSPGPYGAGRTGPFGWLSGKRGALGAGGNEALANAAQLARENLLESIAILLLGLGGLVLPYVFWPVSVVVAMFSRLWDVRDKLVAVAGPLLVALAGSVLTAPFLGGSGNVILAYAHALRVDFGVMIRVGSVLTAAYLAWRVTRGPRVKVPPWRRVKRS